MNSQDAARLWEEYRDGTLSQAQRAAFEAYLAEHPERRVLWERETLWLRALGEGQVPQGVATAAPLTARVLERWHQERQERLTIGRRWRSALFTAGWIAAAACVALVMWLNQPPEPAPRPAGTTGAGPATGGNPGFSERGFGGGRFGFGRRPDSIGLLVHDLTLQYERQPQRVSQAWQDAWDALRLEQVVQLLAPADEPAEMAPQSAGGAGAEAGPAKLP